MTDLNTSRILAFSELVLALVWLCSGHRALAGAYIGLAYTNVVDSFFGSIER